MEYHVKPVYTIGDVKAVESRLKEELESMIREETRLTGQRRQLVSVECIEIKSLGDRLGCAYGVAVVKNEDDTYNIDVIRDYERKIEREPLAVFFKDFKVTWYCCEDTHDVCPAVKRDELSDVVATDIETLLKYLYEHGIHVMFFKDPIRHAKAYLVALRHFSEIVHVKGTDKCPCDRAIRLYETTPA